jgi:hypothetical protein
VAAFLVEGLAHGGAALGSFQTMPGLIRIMRRDPTARCRATLAFGIASSSPQR